jgi:hypothetical protein
VPVDPGPTPTETPPADTSGGGAGGGDTTPVAGDGGGGGSTDGSGDGGGSPSQKQPAHAGGDNSGNGSGSTSSSAPAAVPGQGGQQPTSPAAAGNPDSWLGQDTFVVDRTGGGPGPGSGPGSGHPGVLPRSFAGLYALGAVSRASRLEAKARRGREAAKISALGGPPGSGHRLPDQNPFFNLLSGSGGSAAGLALVSILAVLGGALVLPRDRSTRFRTPTVTWRPLAYVPPIELPG